MQIDRPIGVVEFYRDIETMTDEMKILFESTHADMMKKIKTGLSEGWTPERLVYEIEKEIQ
jgi:hypothetical protein